MVAAIMATEINRLCTTVRHATDADVPAITSLINRAYQVEKFFVDGERTSEAEVRELRRKGVFLVLDHPNLDREGELAGAVYVQMRGSNPRRGYFGLLSVSPELQGHGVGSRLVGVAEALCQAEGCAAMDLQVVNLRSELPSWYRSLGYQEAGTAPFPKTPPPKQPCHFIRMTKELSLD